MARADLESIVTKYKQLFATYYDEEPVGAAATVSNAPVDGYVDPERFIREPLKGPEQLGEVTQGKEQYAVRALFAGVDQDEYLDPMSFVNQREVVEENALRLDILAAGIAWRFAAHDDALMQMYDPSVGMYSTQALFTPPQRMFRWGGAPKEKRIHIRPELDPKKGKGCPKVTKELEKRKLLGKSIKQLKRKKNEEEESFYEEDEKQRKKKHHPFFKPLAEEEND